MRNKGFTLIEMMIVIAIIAIIAAIAIPSMLRSRIATNETAACASNKALAEAEEIYHRTDYNTDGVLEYAQHLRGDWSLLENSGGSGDLACIDKNLGGAEGTTTAGTGGSNFKGGAAVPKAGYVFGVMTQQGSGATGGVRNYIPDKKHMSLGYAFSGTPAGYDSTGRSTFIINSNGTIFQCDQGSAASAAHPTIFDPTAIWAAVD